MLNVNHSLYLYSFLFSPPSPLSSLFKKMELMEACRYGLVDQVHYFIKTGVNVNMADFVSCVSTCEGRIMYMNSRCMHVCSQYVDEETSIACEHHLRKQATKLCLSIKLVFHWS